MLESAANTPPAPAAGQEDELKVADRIARTMHAFGVRFAFGIPGNDVLELIRACESAGIRFVLAKSEPSAAFMADAASQLTGRPTACIFALGPGVANGVSGVAGALMERTPMIVLGGEMAGDRREIYTHQVFNHTAVMAPVVKWSAELNADRAAQQVAKALDIATAHPPGPVYLNCPADASRAVAGEPADARPATRHLGCVAPEAAASEIDRLRQARRPLALIGRDALHASVEGPVNRFIEAWRMPFLATYKAKGLVSERSEYSLGSHGLSPVVDAVNLDLVRDADCLVLIGFDPIEHRDAWIDAWDGDKACLTISWVPQTHRVFPTGAQLVGDMGRILEALTPDDAPRETHWDQARLDAHRGRVAEIVRPREGRPRMSPAALLHAVNERVSDDLVLTVDVGAHRILANHIIDCVVPGQLVQSNGLGCMGYGIPAAIGAALATGRPAIALIGDGCALMSLGELALVAELDLPITVIVLNDDSLALIELKQSKMNVATGAVRFRSPNFAALAGGFGIGAERVETTAAFAGALDTALAGKGPRLIEALTDNQEYWDQM